MSITDTDVEVTASPETDAESQPTDSPKRPSHVSVSLWAAVTTVVILLLSFAIGTLGWLYARAESALEAQALDASNRQKAEEVAAHYAVNAADMDYRDFNAWKVKLVDGTSPELKDKLTKAADQMEQVLAPLQWTSTAKPLATKVRSVSGSIYTVDSFVSVQTKTMQAPEGLQSTATYSVTLDAGNDWQITDVGGIDATLGGK